MITMIHVLLELNLELFFSNEQTHTFQNDDYTVEWEFVIFGHIELSS